MVTKALFGSTELTVEMVQFCIGHIFSNRRDGSFLQIMTSKLKKWFNFTQTLFRIKFYTYHVLSYITKFMVPV